MSDSWKAPVEKKRSRRTRLSGDESDNYSDEERSNLQQNPLSEERAHSQPDVGYHQPTYQYPPVHPHPSSHHVRPSQSHWHVQPPPPYYMPHGQGQHYMPPYDAQSGPPKPHLSLGAPPYYYGQPPHLPPSYPHGVQPHSRHIRNTPDKVKLHGMTSPPTTNIVQSPIETRDRKRKSENHRQLSTIQTSHSQSTTHDAQDVYDNRLSLSSSSSSSRLLRSRVSTSTAGEDVISLERKAKKNAQSRARAAKLRERIKSVKDLEEEQKSEEQKKLIETFEERRRRKNERSRERAIEKKKEIERILSKPESIRTDKEKLDLEIAMRAKEKKNRGDRIRRERIKMMGLSKGKKPPLPRGRPRKRKEPDLSSKTGSIQADQTLTEQPASPASLNFASPDLPLPSPSLLMMFPSPSSNRRESEAEGIDPNTINSLTLPMPPFTPPISQLYSHTGVRRSPRLQRIQQRQQQHIQELDESLGISTYPERRSVLSPSGSLVDIDLQASSAVNLNEVSDFLSELNEVGEVNSDRGEEEKRSRNEDEGRSQKKA